MSGSKFSSSRAESRPFQVFRRIQLSVLHMSPASRSSGDEFHELRGGSQFFTVVSGVAGRAGCGVCKPRSLLAEALARRRGRALVGLDRAPCQAEVHVQVVLGEGLATLMTHDIVVELRLGPIN
jgi:hypothetical protein